MSAVKSLEKSLENIFVKNAPALPPAGKKFIVQVTPWVTLVLGIFSLLAAYSLWHWAHAASKLVDYANQLSQLYGGETVATNRMTVAVWLALIVVIVEGVIYIAAFPALRKLQKSGWNLLFYALLINVVYGVVMLFDDYGGIGSLIGSIIGTAIGLYFLFQIRASYKTSKSAAK